MPEIRIPDLAESITEGTIAQWLVKSGDRINKGDPVIELETDKVNIEVISEYRGYSLRSNTKKETLSK